MYDLEKNEWTRTSPFRLNTFKNDDEDNFKCGLCYNPCCNDKMYLVSSLGRTAKYDFHKNGWSVLYEALAAHDLSMRFDVGPIVWNYDHSPQVLHCVGGKVPKKKNAKKQKRKYMLQYKTFDVRDSGRQWVDAMCDMRQFKDVDFYHMFV